MKTKFICRCDNPTCAKCLSINCQDDNCPVHTKEKKEAYKIRWETDHGKPFPKNE